VALAGAGEVLEGGFEEDTAEAEAARLVDDGADEVGGETENEEKIIAGDTEDDSEVVVEVL